MRSKKVALSLAAALTCLLGHAALVINEVCYDNSKIADEAGNTSSDWIELYNSGPSGVNVSGYGVGDATPYAESDGVRLPNYTIPPGGFLLVFANSLLAEYTAWTNAPNVTLIPPNASWRYLAPSSAPSATWKTNSFDDSSWPLGMSPLGYNDAKQNLDCASKLGYGGNPASRYTAAYFRSAVWMPNASVVTGLQMNARLNDGAAVYLNGREVYRYNMPGGTIGYSTLASTGLSSTLWVSVLLPTNALIQGTNVVAVEVHQASASSADLIMDMTLTALVSEQVPFVHGHFGLDKTGEKVHLFDSSLVNIQSYTKPSAEPGENKSYGYVTDGNTAGARAVYDPPTPRLPNDAYTKKVLPTLTAETPVFSVPPGAYASSQTLTISTPPPLLNLRIYYTFDGSDPRDSSTFINSGQSLTLSNLPPATAGGLAWIRTNPVEVSNSVPAAAWLPPLGSVARATVLRAITFTADRTQCSPEKQGTYFIGPAFVNRTLPVVSLIAYTNDLFGFTNGIYVPGKTYADSPVGYGSNKWGKAYANYHLDSDIVSWERPLHFELLETSQAAVSVAQVLGATMYGGGTRAIPQKTLYLMARLAEYGNDRIMYKLFPNEAPASYKRFLLRNSGNDWYGPDYGGVATMMKDAAFHEIVKGLNQSVMAYRPAVAYINGEYWGIHNIRESYDKHYLATRYGLDPDNVDILMHEEDPSDSDKIVITRVDGNKSADEDYLGMIEWADTNKLGAAATSLGLQAQIDVTNLTDYIVSETFFANTDWPANNCDFWRAHTNQVAACGKYGDTRWRWMLYDLDVSGEKGYDFNMFTYLSDGKMTGKKAPGFLINKLWADADFCNFFVTRYANLLNTTFRTERMAGIIGQDANAIEPEIETHFRRWGRAYTKAQWRQAVTNALVQFTAARQTVSWGHLNAHFALGGVGDLTVRNSRANGVGGRFTVNGVTIDTTTDGVTNRAAWKGSFFHNLAVPVQAVPDAGYVFVGWVGTSVTNATASIIVGPSPTTAVGLFRPASPEGYERWQMENYSTLQILDGVSADMSAPSGCAGLSNFELYAFGMRRNDGLTDEQRQARMTLSIHSVSNALWVGYARLNSGFTDVRYALKIADSLSAPIVWRDAVTGADVDAVAVTNSLDASTWHYEVRLPATSPIRDARFFRLETTQP